MPYRQTNQQCDSTLEKREKATLYPRLTMGDQQRKGKGEHSIRKEVGVWHSEPVGKTEESGRKKTSE